MPSLLIIPFVLLAGKLAEKRDFVRLLKVGLWMFAASGVLYLFSDKMWQLMVVSALLGIGSGVIISSEGREVSICISSSVAYGKMVVSCPKIGDTANPGKEVNAETDQMPTSVIRGIVPLPVLIFI